MSVEKKTVLFFQEAWGRGGIETFVMNTIRTLGTDAFNFEIWSAYDWYNGFDDELASRGISRFAAFPGEMPSLVRRFCAGRRLWNERLSKGDVDVVHVNAMNGSTFAYVDIARRNGVPVRIAHSHNTDFGGAARALKGVLHRIGRGLWSHSATNRLACSEAAGSYLFGGGSFRFLPNGIDINRFTFDYEKRRQTRTSLGIPEQALVIGNIGRLSEQKNPQFMVRVLAELVASGIEARLLLTGNGELENEVSALASDLGVADLYVHVSSVDDPESYYCALDVFVMPSVFEGLPYSLIEAQCSGLPCVVSEAIHEEACVTPLVTKTLLSRGASSWAEYVVDAFDADRDRTLYSDLVESAGFSVEATASVIEEVYRRARG